MDLNACFRADLSSLIIIIIIIIIIIVVVVVVIFFYYYQYINRNGIQSKQIALDLYSLCVLFFHFRSR